MAEVVAVQAAAVATVGVAEAALPALIAAQNRILNGILNEFAAEFVAKLIGETLGPIKEHVEQAVNKLVYEEVAEGAGSSKTTLEGLIEDRGITMPKWSENAEVQARWTEVLKRYASGVRGHVDLPSNRPERRTK